MLAAARQSYSFFCLLPLLPALFAQQSASFSFIFYGCASRFHCRCRFRRQPPLLPLALIISQRR
jgi:hypothetical protein